MPLGAADAAGAVPHPGGTLWMTLCARCRTAELQCHQWSCSLRCRCCHQSLPGGTSLRCCCRASSAQPAVVQSAFDALFHLVQSAVASLLFSTRSRSGSLHLAFDIRAAAGRADTPSHRRSARSNSCCKADILVYMRLFAHSACDMACDHGAGAHPHHLLAHHGHNKVVSIAERG